MKTNRISSVSFTANIIDMHGHIGRFNSAGKQFDFKLDSLDEFVKSPLDVNVNGIKQQDNVVKMIISNLDCLADGENGQKFKNETDGNLDILKICDENPKFYALATCNPTAHRRPGAAVEIQRLLTANPDKFVGLKLHPTNANLAASNIQYREYMRLAELNKLPCLFHSAMTMDDAGNPLEGVASPRTIYNLAKEHESVPVILGHMGAGGEKAHQEAIKVLLESIDKNDAKLYVDISWVDWGKDGVAGLSSESKPSIVKVIKELQKRNKLERILFGTDAPLGCFGEAPAGGLTPKQAYEKVVQDLKNVIKKNFGDSADNIIDKVFYQNAEDLFFKKDWTEVKTEVPKCLSTLQVGGIIVAGLAVLGGIKYLINKTHPAPKKPERNLIG